MTPSAGTLKIALARRDAEISVSLTPPQVPQLAQIFMGQPAEHVARTVPLIYNVCAAAQEAAVRSALGLPLPWDLADRMAAECLREHVLKLCMIWPSALGLEPDRAALSLAGRARQDPNAARQLAVSVLGAAQTVPSTLSELSDWMMLGETVPARTFAHIAGSWDQGWGRADLPVLDAAKSVDWDSATQQGRAVENAPASRMKDSALLEAIASNWGHGPIWRMAARLVECADLLHGQDCEPAADGMAQAARGVMMVNARAGDDGLSAFRRLSPTDFAIVPNGVLETALASLPTEKDAPLEQVAKLVVDTVDPCIATDLEVTHA